MFINFWYPAAESAQLTDTPLHVQMLGQEFVLFRDSGGTAHCLANVCVHRGGSLAHGRVRGDCVECPYHGWRYDGEGQCVRIPTMAPDARLPARAKVDSYPVQEKYGLVFAFLGDLPEEERIPLMAIPEYGQPGWTATIQHWNFDINYQRSMENGVDPAHNEFVHPTHGFSGTRDDYHLKERKVLDKEWGSWLQLGGVAPPLPDPKMREASGRTESAIIDAETGHHGVASIWTFIHPSPTMFIHQYLFENPDRRIPHQHLPGEPAQFPHRVERRHPHDGPQPVRRLPGPGCAVAAEAAVDAARPTSRKPSCAVTSAWRVTASG